MSKARVIVLSVVHQGLTKAEAARRYGVSWQWVHTLITRYDEGGLDALEPRFTATRVDLQGDTGRSRRPDRRAP